MSQFHPEDFRDSIDDMCDDALRRMYAFQEGHFDDMRPEDHYFSEIEQLNETLEVVEYDTQTRAVIAGDIHKDVIEDSIPDYVRDILGGATIALARHAAFRGRGSSVIVPTHEIARSYVSERLLLNSHVVQERKPVKIISYELGSLGTTSLIVGPCGEEWELYYDSHRRTSLIRF